MEMHTVEEEHGNTYVVTESGSNKRKTEHFPKFMIGISVIQVKTN